jgi:hypothetical protein
MIRRTFLRCLPFAGLATALCILMYLAVQQTGRQLANDPQIQLAREASSALRTGQSIGQIVPAAQIDLSTSQSPFISAVADDGTVVASSARLHGELRTVPRGVLGNVRVNGEERVTWQPEPGVRMATVVVRNPASSGGFIVVGRSLAETESRISRIGSLLLVGWALTLAVVIVLVAAGEFFDRAHMG